MLIEAAVICERFAIADKLSDNKKSPPLVLLDIGLTKLPGVLTIFFIKKIVVVAPIVICSLETGFFHEIHNTLNIHDNP